MNKKLIVSCLSALTFSCALAQVEAPIVTDSSVVESVDMPEGLFVSEEELMQDYTNQNNISEGIGEARTLSYDDSVLISRLSRIPTTIELPLNDVTKKYIDTYSTRMKGAVSIMLASSNFYNPIFEEALERYDLPLELKYLPVIESGLRPSATSRAGAAGLWQFMLATGKRYGLEVNTLVDERRDPIKSSEAAARYLRDLYDMFGDWGLAIAAYNCGEGNVQKAILRSTDQASADFWSVYSRLPHETRGYVPAFIAATYIMNYYCEHGIVPRETSLPLESDTIIVQREVTFAQIASQCNVTVDELRAINPQYRRDIVPADYVLRLPASAIEDFIMKEDSIYAPNAATASLKVGARRSVVDDVEDVRVERKSPGRTSARSSKRTHNTRSQTSKSVSVKRGDTLSDIARRNGTTVSNLKKMNNMRGDMIRAGQKLRVK